MKFLANKVYYNHIGSLYNICMKYKNKKFIDIICINNIILIIDNIRKENYTFNDEWCIIIKIVNINICMKKIYILKILRY